MLFRSHFVKDSAQGLAKLMNRDFANTDLVAIYVDGIIVCRHHILAAIGVDPAGTKHVLGLAPGSSENAKVVKDLLGCLAERGTHGTSFTEIQIKIGGL